MRNATSWPHVLVTISLLLPTITQAGGTYQGPMLVGVLEEMPGAYVGEASHSGVQVLFRQDADGWDPSDVPEQNTACVRHTTPFAQASVVDPYRHAEHRLDSAKFV
jgi:hypothetical protein